MKRIFLIIVLLFCSITYSFPSTQKLRIISLAPSTTEILFALGLDDEIVGVSQFCNYPPGALTKEKIGTFSSVNIEKVLLLKPDIIFCTGLQQAEAIMKLRQLNLKVYVSDPVNFEELFDSIKTIGRLVNKEKQALALIEEMKINIEKINSKVRLIPQEKRAKVFVEIWHNPLITVGPPSFIDELLTLAGAINIAYDTKRPYSYFSPEQVIKRNPDCIILAYMVNKDPVDTITKRFGWNNISAVKNNRIYNDINPDLFLRPGPRLVKALQEIHKKLYP